MSTPLHENLILANSLAHVAQRSMEPWGLHGIAHWWRVRHNGLLVAAHTGADTRVVRLFALIHDSFREDDGHDPLHGLRAAKWLARVRQGELQENDVACASTRAAIESLDDVGFDQLHRACELHTSSITTDDATINTCFAADRLDLARVGFRPDPRLIPVDRALLTDAFIDAAMRRTVGRLGWIENDEFLQAWGIDVDLAERG
ncbi:MAG: hypothetical protein DWI11_08090 [Planctomycetota bacterium]|nr:MAG: hypothetical protein DWI11_08090 [Planctomycetota bacterium]